MTETHGDEYVTSIGADEQASETVLRAVAAVSDRPLLELPPLGESVDSDSLDRLFGAPTTARSLRFGYAGYEVTVEPERVRVRERR